MPSVNALHREFRSQGLEVLLIDFRESADRVRRVVKERGYIAPVLVDQSGDTTGRVYGVFGTPTVYFIDRQSRLVGRAVGARDWEAEPMRRLVHSLVQPGGGR